MHSRILARPEIARIALSALLAALVGTLLLAPSVARAAECHCVAIAIDVSAGAKAKAELGDSLYASGKFSEALAVYAQGWAVAKDPAFLYAQAMCQAQLGSADAAKALFQQYLASGAKTGLKFAGRAEAALAGGASLGGTVLGGVTGAAAALEGDVEGGVTGGMGAGADFAADVTAKPKKVAKGAAIVLGVVAVGAVAAVGIQGIAAGVKDDIDFDYKFGIGMGLAGVTVGATAIYLYGLTATTGAVSPRCVSRRPIVAPVVYAHGGGMAAAFSF